MSKKIKTEDRIVAKALEMFNERGIEYVGLREIAAILGMRVSNITYYFPTKDDLVNRLSLDLHKANSQVIIEREDLTMTLFLEMFHKALQNQVRYRCLLLSFVHLMTQNKLIAERYNKTQETRGTTLKSNLEILQRRGYLKRETEIDTDFLASVMSLLARFWISEATVRMGHLTHEEQINRCIITLGKFLLPYATEKGRDEIERFIER